MNNDQKAIMSVLCLLMFLSGSASFQRGMCVRVTHCLAGFESLLFPSGGVSGKNDFALCFAGKTEVRIIHLKTRWVCRDGERQQAQQQTAAKTIIIKLQNGLKEQRTLPEIPGGNSLTHAHTDVSLPACGVIVKMSFQ